MYMKFQNFTFDYNKIAKSLLYELKLVLPPSMGYKSFHTLFKVNELVLVPSWYSLMFAQSEGLILLSKVAFRLCNNIISIALLLRGLFIIEKKLLRKKSYGLDP